MSQPIRMCIICRERYDQHKLLRLQKLDDIVRFSGNGRSFYLCKACLQKENIDTVMTKRFKLQKESQFFNIKKEFLSDG